MITPCKSRARTALGVLVVGVGLLVAACSSQSARRQGDFDALKHALPGVWGNADESSAAGSGGAAPALSLSISPVAAQTIGDSVFFVRATAAGNDRLVLDERIWTLELDSNGRMLQHIFLLRDPRRWVSAAEHLDVLLSLLPEDLEPLAGCDLLWHKTAAGFETAQAPQSCQPGRFAGGSWIEQHARLEGTQLSLGERQTSADGALLPASSAAFTLALRRTASVTGVAH